MLDNFPCTTTQGEPETNSRNRRFSCLYRSHVLASNLFMRSLRLAKLSRQVGWNILCWSNSSYMMKSTKVICWREKKAENSLTKRPTAVFVQHTHAYIFTRKPLLVSQEVWELLQFVRQIFDVRLLLPILEVKEAMSPISSCTDINDTSSSKNFWRGTHKVTVAQPDKAVPEVHGLVLQDVDSDHLILRLATYDDIRLSGTPTQQGIYPDLKKVDQRGIFCLIH